VINVSEARDFFATQQSRIEFVADSRIIDLAR
jgi:hypothetical protein